MQISQITQITQKLHRNYAEITQKLCKLRRNYAEIKQITQKLRRNYAEITQKLRRNYAEITQKLRTLRKLRIVKIITQKLRKNYATSWETRHFTKITQKLRILRKNYAYYANAKKLRRLRTPHSADVRVTDTALGRPGPGPEVAGPGVGRRGADSNGQQRSIRIGAGSPHRSEPDGVGCWGRRG